MIWMAERDIKKYIELSKKKKKRKEKVEEKYVNYNNPFVKWLLLRWAPLVVWRVVRWTNSVHLFCVEFAPILSSTSQRIHSTLNMYSISDQKHVACEKIQKYTDLRWYGRHFWINKLKKTKKYPFTIPGYVIVSQSQINKQLIWMITSS